MIARKARGLRWLVRLTFLSQTVSFSMAVNHSTIAANTLQIVFEELTPALEEQKLFELELH
jgi:hypothetical protein